MLILRMNCTSFVSAKIIGISFLIKLAIAKDIIICLIIAFLE